MKNKVLVIEVGKGITLEEAYKKVETGLRHKDKVCWTVRFKEN